MICSVSFRPYQYNHRPGHGNCRTAAHSFSFLVCIILLSVNAACSHILSIKITPYPLTGGAGDDTIFRWFDCIIRAHCLGIESMRKPFLLAQGRFLHLTFYRIWHIICLTREPLTSERLAAGNSISKIAPYFTRAGALFFVSYKRYNGTKHNHKREQVHVCNHSTSLLSFVRRLT